MSRGSPTSVISGIVHFKSNACEVALEVRQSRPPGTSELSQSARGERTLLSTILKIFCTLIEWLVEQKINGAFIAFENRFACMAAEWCGSGSNVREAHGRRESDGDGVSSPAG